MKVIRTVTDWCFLLYFLILFAERMQSLVRSCTDPAVRLLGSPFDGYVNLLTMGSLAAALILLIGWNGGFWKSLVDPTAEVNYTMLCVTAGVILLSGMVHTEYTVAPIQFVSYGFLILAMILKTVTVQSSVAHPALLWFSLVYLTALSMAIPVMYRSEMPHAALFHTLEAIAAIVLVAAFTFLMRRVFLGQGENLFLWLPILLTAVLDTLIVALRWREKVNTFVLIFLIASVVLFAVGKTVTLLLARKPAPLL